MASGSNITCQWKYDVFLSFRGVDTRTSFTDYMYEKLQDKNVKTFRDDPKLEKGTNINPELMKAIEESRFAIVVLSKKYATSTWCLSELAHIVKCTKEKGTRILPIFFHVEPSDVRHIKASFAEAFTDHEKTFGKESKNVRLWKDALGEVGKLAGWTLKEDRYETDLIKEIVQDVWKRVNPTFKLQGDSTPKSGGIDNKLKKVYLSLNDEAKDVRFIGIQGIHETGNTTLARLVYDRISPNFQVSCFLEDVGEVAKTKSLLHLQQKFLSSILKENIMQVSSVYDGKNMIKSCVLNKKVLLVLDDVDQSDQIFLLAGEKDWFGLGSRIIITTRNPELLVTNRIRNVVEGLSKDEVLQLSY
ncbi:TMV resistance protein N-like [Pyrus ussuriensis x Pyrus communis]|uniref:TMV resistance protein N-like n=1 Tax=Pyrus ussuriensis x Pyrus communis TaxID=2448454 RepID=A0A5N5I4V2_9ROSA|nr:TMV resistance protein N-like [Pyrus ussuriensis x Pyrus communis]